MRLDEDKLEALRSWGMKLRQGGDEESVAVGRAILMLVDEIDRLHIDLWHARLQEDSEDAAPTDVAAEAEEVPVASRLHGRLQRALRRNSSPAAPPPTEEAGPDTASAEPTSPQAWLDALRGQK